MGGETQHVCSKEAEIVETNKICKRLDIALRGNGKPGLFTQFAVLKNTVAGLIALDILIVAGLISVWLGK